MPEVRQSYEKDRTEFRKIEREENCDICLSQQIWLWGYHSEKGIGPCAAGKGELIIPQRRMTVKDKIEDLEATDKQGFLLRHCEHDINMCSVAYTLL